MITASLGMLVKQWLREFLAGDYYSPQARLRVRQFRREGLSRWRVFEIAALLPLLLQVALGLFFLGLCIFTRSINDAVGRTTVPLVSGWILFFVLTIIAPAFSARCPYKITFLISALKVIRRWIRHDARRLTKWLSSWHEEPSHVESPPDRAFDSSSMTDLGQSFNRLRSCLPREEEETVISEKYDLKILLAVDAIFSNDSLINDTFRTYIWRLRICGDEAIDFVLQIMGRRLQRGRSISSSDLPLTDLRPLTKRAWIGLTGILADILHNEISQDLRTIGDENGESSRQLSPWMQDMLKIVLSDTGYTFQQSEAEILTSALVYDPLMSLQIIHESPRRVSIEDFIDVVEHSRKLFLRLPLKEVVDCLRHIGCWCARRVVGSTDTLYDILTCHLLASGEGVMDVIGVLLEGLRVEAMWRAEGDLAAERWHDWLDDALGCAIHAYGILSASGAEIGNICKIVGYLCAESESAMHHVLLLITRHLERGSGVQGLLAECMRHSSISNERESRGEHAEDGLELTLNLSTRLSSHLQQLCPASLQAPKFTRVV